MSVPIIGIIMDQAGCQLEKTTGDRLACVGVAFDTLLSISCLIAGILGAVGTIAMSPAAAYSLIGVSCFITAAWIGGLIYVCKNAN